MSEELLRELVAETKRIGANVAKIQQVTHIIGFVLLGGLILGALIIVGNALV